MTLQEVLDAKELDGKIAGALEATLSIAKNMKLKGMDIPTIIELTGLSTEEVEAI